MRLTPDLPARDKRVESWDVRIGRHLTLHGEALVSPRIAAWLEDKAGLTSDRRILLRGTDPEAYAELAALHVAALYYRSDLGTESPVHLRSSSDLETWMTTTDLAKLLGVTDRAIRKWIASARIPAT